MRGSSNTLRYDTQDVESELGTARVRYCISARFDPATKPTVAIALGLDRMTDSPTRGRGVSVFRRGPFPDDAGLVPFYLRRCQRVPPLFFRIVHPIMLPRA